MEHDHSDLERPSCSAHWMQSCQCSESEITEAMKKRADFVERIAMSKPVSLKQLIKDLKLE